MIDWIDLTCACWNGAIALLYPPTVRVRATVKVSAAFFRDESSITIGVMKVGEGGGDGMKVQ